MEMEKGVQEARGWNSIGQLNIHVTKAGRGTICREEGDSHNEKKMNDDGIHHSWYDENESKE